MMLQIWQQAELVGLDLLFRYLLGFDGEVLAAERVLTDQIKHACFVAFGEGRNDVAGLGVESDYVFHALLLSMFRYVSILLDSTTKVNRFFLRFLSSTQER